MARILAIDYGTKRTGLAVTDSLQITPGALDTVPTHQLLNYLADYLEREEVETIVLGKPTQMDATPSATWQAIQALAKKLQHLYPQIRLEYVDERFTSVLAQQTIREAGIGKQRRRQDKGLVDRVSATIILQSYLESLRMLH